MDSDFISFMQGFANRRHLRNKVSLEFRSDGDRPRLYCDEPAVVARFSSELRQKTLRDRGPSTRVLLRGQTCDHKGMKPGLFRYPSRGFGASELVAAEEAFEREVRKAIRIGRFLRPKLSALLQHYGYRTSWLDVVDNLWAAVWFASHRLSTVDSKVKATPTPGSGWLYFLAVPDHYSVVDLRDSHHGLSLRPHAQAGWSIRGAGDAISDHAGLVAAVVEFPINQRWQLVGHMASEAFFFPSSRLDTTFSRLKKRDIDGVARRVESEQRLPAGALGRLFPGKTAA